MALDKEFKAFVFDDSICWEEPTGPNRQKHVLDVDIVSIDTPFIELNGEVARLSKSDFLELTRRCNKICALLKIR